ncbi:MAG: hypothetical protein ACXVB0_19605 [Mucilaginibacter sp.]
MKKLFLGLILVYVMMLSCKKEHHSTVNVSQSTTHKVTFTVGFSQGVGAIQINSLKTNSFSTSSAPDTSLTNHIHNLYYMVFDSVGNSVHNITQASTDTAFGKYTDNLHPGKYTVAIAGGTNLTLNSGNLAATYISNSNGFVNDAFFEKVSIIVGNTDLTQGFSLNRITSKLVVNINDALPNDPQAVGKLTLSGVGYAYFVGTGNISNVQNAGYSYVIPASALGTKNFRMTTYFLYNGPFTAEIYCGVNPALIYGDKIVTGVTGAANKITILSGNLFGGGGTNSTGGFQVAVDTAWNSTVTKTFP